MKGDLMKKAIFIFSLYVGQSAFAYTNSFALKDCKIGGIEVEMNGASISLNDHDRAGVFHTLIAGKSETTSIETEDVIIRGAKIFSRFKSGGQTIECSIILTPECIIYVNGICEDP
jgi:hypothetical protein